MTVSSITSAQPTTSTSSINSTSSAAGSTTALSYNSFLSLLVSELQNQDPTQPMDPSTMVSQLATISEVGQAVQTNTNLSSLLTATSLTQAEQLIGKSVTSSDGTISGTVTSVTVNSSGATANLSNGQQVQLGTGATISS